jgi:hypothetical protein
VVTDYHQKTARDHDKTGGEGLPKQQKHRISSLKAYEWRRR